MTNAMRWLRYLACFPIAATAQAQAPCTTATPACTEWVTSPSGPGRLLVYRSHALTRPNAAITRAFILIHGAERDAHNYYRHALAAAFLAGTLENAIVISPRFAPNDGRNCEDSLAPGEANWDCGGPGQWTAGGAASGSASLTTFDITDDLLRHLARRDIFPNLSAIVIGGHSAGGQFSQRYAMANQVHEKLGVPVTYIRFASERHGATHQAVPVPSCGHNGRCMFTSEEAEALALVFPKR